MRSTLKCDTTRPSTYFHSGMLNPAALWRRKRKIDLEDMLPLVSHETRTMSSLASLFFTTSAGSRGRRATSTAEKLMEMSKCRAFVTAAMQIFAD